MIYPKKIDNRKSEKLVNSLLFCSVIIAIVLVFINKITSPRIPWAAITNIGIIHIWITVIYAIKRNTNIAAHVLLQMIVITVVIGYIDNRLGFKGWSLYIGMPIVLIVANITMVVLQIVNYKNYIKYAMYQLFIVLISLFQIVPILIGTMELRILNKISIGISVLNFVISLVFSYKKFYKVLLCKFHI